MSERADANHLRNREEFPSWHRSRFHMRCFQAHVIESKDLEDAPRMDASATRFLEASWEFGTLKAADGPRLRISEARVSVAVVTAVACRRLFQSLVLLGTAPAFRRRRTFVGTGNIQLCRYLGGFAMYQTVIHSLVNEWFENWTDVLDLIERRVSIKVGRCKSLV